MRGRDTNGEDAQALALHALAWILGDGPRTERFLALTGIEPADLRARLDDPALLGEVVGHLAAHEPDLIACADAIGSTPHALVTARTMLEIR